MNYFNYWMDRDSAREINNEVEFVSGKLGISEERVIELMKIQMLNKILVLMEGGNQEEQKQDRQ